jgi:hypothetical protein
MRVLNRTLKTRILLNPWLCLLAVLQLLVSVMYCLRNRISLDTGG